MLALVHGNLIRGDTVIPEDDATVLIDGNKITDAGRGIPVPENAQVIDVKGGYILPGFSDAHTHFGGSADVNRQPHCGRYMSYDYAEHREAALDWGVTAVRSGGDYMRDIVGVRDDIEAGRITGPHIVAAGKMIQAKGGHPGYTVLFGVPEILDNEIVQVDDDTDIEAEVNKLIDAGVDWIKFHLSEMDIFHYPQKKKRLTNEQMHRIVDAAHAGGKPVMVHIDDIEGMKEAALCGVDSIEHTLNAGASKGLEMTDEVLDILIGRGIWVVPTMVATYYHDGKTEGVTPIFDKLLAAVGRMIEAGVKIGVGCDSGIPFLPYGKCLHEEMQILNRAGMSPDRIIHAVTAGNAELMGRGDVFGSIEPGKLADIVVLGSDPLKDIKATEDIRMVILGGSVVRDRMMSV